jgi:hypothetical protein
MIAFQFEGLSLASHFSCHEFEGTRKLQTMLIPANWVSAHFQQSLQIWVHPICICNFQESDSLLEIDVKFAKL